MSARAPRLDAATIRRRFIGGVLAGNRLGDNPSAPRGSGSRLGPMAAESGQTDRETLAALLGDPLRECLASVEVRICGSWVRDGFVEQLVEYASGGERVPAYVMLPEGWMGGAAVVVYHQHNGEWHLGKSEVAGRAGDPLQWFGPALARRGVAVLAPDSIAFEYRRRTGAGIDPRLDDPGQHLFEMTSRLVAGRLLMTRVVADAATAWAAACSLPGVDHARVGVLGHSYGGHTPLFHPALPEGGALALINGGPWKLHGRG